MNTISLILILVAIIVTAWLAISALRRADELGDEVAALREDIALANGRIHQRIRGLEERE